MVQTTSVTPDLDIFSPLDPSSPTRFGPPSSPIHSRNAIPKKVDPPLKLKGWTSSRCHHRHYHQTPGLFFPSTLKINSSTFLVIFVFIRKQTLEDSHIRLPRKGSRCRIGARKAGEADRREDVFGVSFINGMNKSLPERGHSMCIMGAVGEFEQEAHEEVSRKWKPRRVVCARSS